MGMNTGKSNVRNPGVRSPGVLYPKSARKKIEGVMPCGLSPSFNCAAKFLRLSGSIWRQNKLDGRGWQVASTRFPVESCARLCKRRFLDEFQEPTYEGGGFSADCIEF